MVGGLGLRGGGALGEGLRSKEMRGKKQTRGFEAICANMNNLLHNGRIVHIAKPDSITRVDARAETMGLLGQRLSALGAIGFALAGFTFWLLADASIKLVGQSGLPARAELQDLQICSGDEV